MCRSVTSALRYDVVGAQEIFLAVAGGAVAACVSARCRSGDANRMLVGGLRGMEHQRRQHGGDSAWQARRTNSAPKP